MYKWLRAEEKLLVSHCFLSLRFVCCLYPCFVQIVSSPAKLGTTCAALNVLLYLCCFKCKYISYEIDIYDIFRDCKFYWLVESLWLPLHKFWSHFGKFGVKYHNEKSHFQTLQHVVLAWITIVMDTRCSCGGSLT